MKLAVEVAFSDRKTHHVEVPQVFLYLHLWRSSTVVRFIDPGPLQRDFNLSQGRLLPLDEHAEDHDAAAFRGDVDALDIPFLPFIRSG